jgi:hypothetical protein
MATRPQNRLVDGSCDDAGPHGCFDDPRRSKKRHTLRHVLRVRRESSGSELCQP